VIHPSAEAERYGLAEAFGSEPLVCSISQSGRGERISADTIRAIVRAAAALAASHRRAFG